MNKTRILLVDDHAVIRMGLASLLGTCAELEVVGSVGDGTECIRESLARRPDVIVLDLQMPEMDGIETARALRRDWPEAKILILTTFGASTALHQALRAGARGAILKSSDLRELRRAIAEVAAGRTYLSAEVEQILATEPSVPDLPPRQREILDSITRGLSNADIATQLGISVPMVKEHLTALFRRLGVSNRTEAVALALRSEFRKL